MFEHEIFFKPGTWIGEGRVTFSTSPDNLHFYTKWSIEPEDRTKIVCQQQVEMRGGGDEVKNYFVISNITDKTFNIRLENEILGFTEGTGVITAKTIAWEFRTHPDFEGFEVYELQENGDYMLHAEYISPDAHRTTIDGRVWKKASS